MSGFSFCLRYCCRDGDSADERRGTGPGERIERVLERRLTQREAAQMLGVTSRQVRLSSPQV